MLNFTPFHNSKDFFKSFLDDFQNLMVAFLSKYGKNVRKIRSVVFM